MSCTDFAIGQNFTVVESKNARLSSAAPAPSLHPPNRRRGVEDRRGVSNCHFGKRDKNSTY